MLYRTRALLVLAWALLIGEPASNAPSQVPIDQSAAFQRFSQHHQSRCVAAYMQAMVRCCCMQPCALPT